MSNDIKDILARLALVESSTSPVSTKKGLTQQQKSVPQLPALFKPKHISVLGNKKDPKHPMAGYAVGADESVTPKLNALEEAMINVEEDMLSKVRRDLNQYLDQLGDRYNDDGRRNKVNTPLDKLSKKSEIDHELIQKAVDAVEQGKAEEDLDEYVGANTVHDIEDQISSKLVAPEAPVQPSTMFEVHGDDDRGYEVHYAGRILPTKFPNRNHAQMAIDLFKSRRKEQQPDSDQDYIEER